MGNKNIEESQEHQQGKAIGQAGRDQGIPDATHGSHEPKKHPADLHVPNQDRSSATNQQKREENKSEDK